MQIVWMSGNFENKDEKASLSYVCGVGGRRRVDLKRLLICFEKVVDLPNRADNRCIIESMYQYTTKHEMITNFYLPGEK